MVTRLEDKLYTQKHKGKSYIDFEKNELLKGLKFIDPLHKAIINKQTIEVVYQSFKAREAQTIMVYPYLLKEYRNRWFVLVKSSKQRDTMLLALDRIESFKTLPKQKYDKPNYDVSTYFNDVIGVTKTLNQRTEKILFHIVKAHAPYLVTKPLHSTQKTITTDDNGKLFSIDVIWNFELERELLGFGEHIKIISPKRLVKRITNRTQQALAQYSA
jgi:predicted DNA-binding transcriptional regulator YafY